jgi:hypothetical protein
MSRLYGPPVMGKFLASFTGHTVCLDYFGEPPIQKAASDLSLHGEAAIMWWNVIGAEEPRKAQCLCYVKLPVSQLIFEREIRLGGRQSVAYIQESVSNERDVDYPCDWVQHVTLGPPFLRETESTLRISGGRGVSSEYDDEGRSLLAGNRQFSWPYAPHKEVGGFADLRQPFCVRGRGFVAAVELEKGRQTEFVLAVNWKLGLGMGYCFRRQDFPWMTIWEENGARQNPPWNGITQARGMEFGTTPLPRGTQEAFHRESLFDAPEGCIVPARGKRTARYLTFLFTIPPGIDSIESVDAIGDAIILSDERGNLLFSVQAEGCEEFLRDEYRAL